MKIAIKHKKISESASTHLVNIYLSHHLHQFQPLQHYIRKSMHPSCKSALNRLTFNFDMLSTLFHEEITNPAWYNGPINVWRSITMPRKSLESQEYIESRAEFRKMIAAKTKKIMADSDSYIKRRELTKYISKGIGTVERLLSGDGYDITAYDLRRLSKHLHVPIAVFYDDIDPEIARYLDSYKRYLKKMNKRERAKIDAALKAFAEQK